MGEVARGSIRPGLRIGNGAHECCFCNDVITALDLFKQFRSILQSLGIFNI